jgi:hypothetical protein
MNRGSVAKQITEAPMKADMKKGGKKGYMGGGMVKGYAKGGKVDQSMCSPRKQMAMGKSMGSGRGK